MLVVCCVVLGATVVGWLVAAVRHGPRAAARITGAVFRDGVLDLVFLSPRRAWALARLAIQESIRRRVVVVFAVFIVILLFAGWFLDPGSPDPARLYLDFVLTVTTYLVLLLALFLSSLSLPADMKSRTLHTVVTKPVRASEVVLGRILGFVAVGTVLLMVMGAISYVFVLRGLVHTHSLTADDLQSVAASAAGQPAAPRSHQLDQPAPSQSDHRCVGPRLCGTEQGHTHRLTVEKNGDKVTYNVGPAEGMFMARVPVYGKLSFRDRTRKAGRERDQRRG